MKLNEELLKVVEEWGALLTPLADLPIILELDSDEFMKEYRLQDKLYKAYQRGRLLTEGKHRKEVIQLAMDGSSPAQEMVTRMIDGLKTQP